MLICPFAIIESGPLKNLVSYSFSSEEDSTLRTVHEDGMKPSQYQCEVSVEEIIIGDTVQSNIKEHDRIDLSTHSNDIVNISKLQDDEAKKYGDKYINNDSEDNSSQYHVEQAAIQMDMKVQRHVGEPYHDNIAQKEEINEDKDQNNNAMTKDEFVQNTQKVERSKQVLLDRWLAMKAEEKRQFPCNSCDNEFFMQSGLQMHMKNAHIQKDEQSCNEDSEVDVSPEGNGASDPRKAQNVQLQLEGNPINDDVQALLSEMLSTVEQ